MEKPRSVTRLPSELIASQKTGPSSGIEVAVAKAAASQQPSFDSQYFDEDLKMPVFSDGQLMT